MGIPLMMTMWKIGWKQIWKMNQRHSFDDGNKRSQGRGSCGSLKKCVHEGGINKSNEEGNVGGNSFQGKDRESGEVLNVSL
jgi:hypothetical protein